VRSIPKAPRASRPRRAAALLGLLIWAAPAAADDAASRNNEGNRFYLRDQLDEALKRYTEAQASRPGAPELHYNIGNVLYRKGEHDKAAEEYLRAQSSPDTVLSQAALYNRGNALLQQNRLQEAINAYVQALRARPDDQDAKRNLELALRRMQEQKKERPDRTPPKDGDQEQESSAGEGKADRKPQDKEPQAKPPTPKGGVMSEEEARRILEALREAEKEGIRRHVRAHVAGERRPERDW
jgi:tetratricopeptide (TPR) repeat protein